MRDRVPFDSLSLYSYRKLPIETPFTCEKNGKSQGEAKKKKGKIK